MPEPRDDTPTTDLDATRAGAPPRLGPSPWPWMLAACVIIAASGAVRVNQEARFEDAARLVETPPFEMANLPGQLGGPGSNDPSTDQGQNHIRWKQFGDDQVLEEETLQIAGCSDYVLRNYRHNGIGVQLTVLVSFGPAGRIFPHSPIECFPANGFQPRGGPKLRTITLEQGTDEGPPRTVRFNAVAYGKPGGGREELREVYYSFWHDGQWSPTAEETEHLFRHRPAMFKVQVERPIIPGEAWGTSGSPIEEFLEDLIPEIERQITESEIWNSGEVLAEE